MIKRKPGAQPGNFNALKHGRRSKRKRAERRAVAVARLREQEERSLAWMESIPETDYGAICDAIAADRQK
jgi:hypothetical protein